MRRGTTPTIVLVNDESLEGSEYFVTIKQGATEITKTGSDCTLSEDGTAVSVPLTQADTLSLDDSELADVQLRYKIGEKAFATNIIKLRVDGILKDGAI